MLQAPVNSQAASSKVCSSMRQSTTVSPCRPEKSSLARYSCSSSSSEAP